MTPSPHRANRLHRFRFLASCTAAACFLTPLPAFAITFNTLGEMAFDPQAVYTEGFESYSSSPGIKVVQGNALEGQKYVELSSYSFGGGGDIPISVGNASTAYRIRAFVRGTSPWYPYIIVYYLSGPGVPIVYATMSPTGRMTSDEWLEIESEPISIDGNRSPYVSLMIATEKIDMDALEVVPEPGAYKPNNVCTNASSCLVDQVCVEGFCQDGNPMVPALPADAHRNLVVDILQRKVKVAFGGVHTRQEPMQQALATMEGMRAASSGWAFWNTFGMAIGQLQDSHTAPVGLPSYLGSGGKAFPICFVEGDADISHTLAPADPSYADVLVSHVGSSENLGLKAGDRLVAVDGMHPIAWLRSQPMSAWIGYDATDLEVHSGVVESLPTAIRALARSVQVIRCTPAGSCSPPETILIANLADGMMVDHPVCDHRPAYHLASGNPNPVTHDFDDVRYGLLADSEPGEDLYGMIWNNTMWDSSMGSNPWASAYSTFRTKAKGLVLDHRRGDGGTAPGAAYLSELSLQPSTVAVWSTLGMLGMFDSPFPQSEGLALFDMWKNDGQRSFVAGSKTPREDMRIALLLARDVSGSDFFPFAVKGSPNTRLFGRKTMGAFSTYFMFEAQGFFGWSLASGDFVDAEGKPYIGVGVEPDENLVPKQSDLVVGKDTVYERALAWVRCGEEVCP